MRELHSICDYCNDYYLDIWDKDIFSMDYGHRFCTEECKILYGQKAEEINLYLKQIINL